MPPTSEPGRSVSSRLLQVLFAFREGHTRLVVNFAGVQYVSCAVLGVLAALQREVELTHGHVTLCGLGPLLRDMLRLTHLDRVFHICTDEAEALRLIAR